ncbi:hypothetical protein [Flavobacterium aquicola]|uniref:Uncharacterized protein n=1 Tax=Flavobacterium aquicola TaxID=1682742 RepID=A0A3E0ERC0_9FLAO|nr:hypothetical protein [Flavobacterium aquicola]REH00763.1 hypothetical protein C8P67_1027 [Flavobacterium aquicola]
MKRKYIICFLILFTISTINAQSKRQFKKVQNSVNEQKLYELVIEKLNTKKKNGCLIYKRNDNIAVKYCDNKSEDKYLEFDELGKIKNTDIIVVNKFTNNEEFYILINPKKSKTLTLYGFPLRIENTNKYLVYNNPTTNIPYSIQILEMKNGELKLITEILYPSNISIKKVLRVDDSEIYILDNNNQTWKTSINKKGVT